MINISNTQSIPRLLPRPKYVTILSLHEGLLLLFIVGVVIRSSALVVVEPSASQTGCFTPEE
jgi:hypothetical protein